MTESVDCPFCAGTGKVSELIALLLQAQMQKQREEIENSKRKEP